MSEIRDVVTLWRPVSPQELRLIEAAEMRAFPPRLPDQPIFYPVLSEAYALQITRDWNIPASGAGYVTRFDVLKRPVPGRARRQQGASGILDSSRRPCRFQPGNRRQDRGDRHFRQGCRHLATNGPRRPLSSLPRRPKRSARAIPCPCPESSFDGRGQRPARHPARFR